VARADYGAAGEVVLTRHEDVLWALRHPEVFSSSAEAVDIGQDQPLIPLQVDPPAHTKYRRLLNPFFVPRKVAELESDSRTLVRSLVDAFADRGGCDFHEEFATPLPSTIFLRLMGLPQSDLPMFLRWRDDTIRPDVPAGDFDAATRAREQASKSISAYFEEAIEARRRRPDDGLLTFLVEVAVDGQPLNREELLGICHLMLIGGLDTVTATLDCMAVYLAHHPEHRRRLVEEPALLPTAIEELLRFESPVMVVLRVLQRDLTLGGVDLHAGDHVTLVIGSANNDERVFADEVQLGGDVKDHLAFGAGHHLCLGAHLARLELRVGLEEFHRRIPDYRIADGADVHYSPGIRQVEHLPLVFET
jgi:cytochrome P450